MGNNQEKKTGLALSGGGFRAMLFHLGSLWRLNEMAILPELSAVSSVSGGALLAGVLAVRWSRLRFRNDVAENFEEEIVAPTLSVSGKTIDLPGILCGIFTGTRTLEGVLRETPGGQSKAAGPARLSGVHFQRLPPGIGTQLDFFKVQDALLAHRRPGTSSDLDDESPSRFLGLPAGLSASAAQARAGRFPTV